MEAFFCAWILLLQSYVYLWFFKWPYSWLQKLKELIELVIELILYLSLIINGTEPLMITTYQFVNQPFAESITMMLITKIPMLFRYFWHQLFIEWEFRDKRDRTNNE